MAYNMARELPFQALSHDYPPLYSARPSSRRLGTTLGRTIGRQFGAQGCSAPPNFFGSSVAHALLRAAPALLPTSGVF
jgi:hypothetical protein